MTAVLGISDFYHDSAAALVIDGDIVAAAREERFTRKKHDPGFPRNAVNYVLSEAGLLLYEVDYVAFYDKPFLKFERLLESCVAYAPKGSRSFNMAIPIWLREKLFQKGVLVKLLRRHDKKFRVEVLLFSEHHLGHAASAFYPSPFEETVILTLDGVGEWATTTVAIGKGNSLDIVKEIHFPHSLGLFYSAFTYYTGFKVNRGEYKVMGLAPYGEPKYRELILDKIVDLKEDGSYRLDQSYFNYAVGLTMTNEKFSDLFGQPVRNPETEDLTQFHMDIAASVQAVTEEVVLTMTRNLAREFDVPNLCMAGGVARNRVANGKILHDGAFKNVWIQPAAGDAGGALGAALLAWHEELGKPRKPNSHDAMKDAYLGPHFTRHEIETALVRCGANFISVSEDEMLVRAARALADGKAVGWFQGRMEFGPRALGGRSILGDPRLETMQKTLNLKEKHRKSFRPFAPSVLREDVADWFETDRDSPYMLFVSGIKKSRRRELTVSEQRLFGIEKINVKRSEIPAVTHVDYSARIQTVHKETNPLYHALIVEFKARTGRPVIVNTSFNVRGEPIVSTPENAFRCFMGTDLDVLVVGNRILHKNWQDHALAEIYEDRYELD